MKLNIKRFTLSLWPLCAIVLVIYPVITARAEFLSRGPLTYVAPIAGGGIVATVITLKTPGVFITFDPKATVQSFDPKRLSEEALSAFLQFDPDKGRFINLQTGSDKTYGVQGSFAVKLGPVTVALNQQATSAYLTVVSDSGPNPSILGLSGQQVVLNRTGIEAVELLSANALLEVRYRDVLSSYTVTGTNEISLGAETLKAGQLGVSIDSSNPCLDSGAIILEGSDYQKFIESDPLQRQQTKGVSLSNLTILNITPSFVAALNSEGELRVIRSDKNTPQVCHIAPISIESKGDTLMQPKMVVTSTKDTDTSEKTP